MVPRLFPLFLFLPHLRRSFHVSPVCISSAALLPRFALRPFFVDGLLGLLVWLRRVWRALHTSAMLEASRPPCRPSPGRAAAATPGAAPGQSPMICSAKHLLPGLCRSCHRSSLRGPFLTSVRGCRSLVPPVLVPCKSLWACTVAPVPVSTGLRFSGTFLPAPHLSCCSPHLYSIAFLFFSTRCFFPQRLPSLRFPFPHFFFLPWRFPLFWPCSQLLCLLHSRRRFCGCPFLPLSPSFCSLIF